MSFVALLIVVVAAIIIGILVKERRSRDRGLAVPWPLEPRRTVLSERERELYRRLVQSLPELTVLAQVQLLQVLNFQRGRKTYAVLNRIGQLSLDFLVLNSDTSPIATIELDDVSHDASDRRRADANKSHALKSAGVPLIRWSARNLPDAAVIRETVLAHASATAAPKGADARLS